MPRALMVPGCRTGCTMQGERLGGAGAGAHSASQELLHAPPMRERLTMVNGGAGGHPCRGGGQCRYP